MAEREVIREFLATLGFKVDAVSLRTFTKSLDFTAFKYAGLAGAAAGTAVAIEQMMTKFAHAMENLYYLSQRTQVPIGTLKNMRFAAGQVGLTAEQISQTMDTIAMKLRMNPALGQWMRTLGMDPRSPASIVRRLKEMFPGPDEQFKALQWAEIMGITADVFVQMSNNLDRFDKTSAENQKRLETLGIDFQKAGKEGVEYSNQLRRIGNDWDLLGMVFTSRALPAVTGIATAIGNLTDSLIRLFNTEGFKNFVEWSTKLQVGLYDRLTVMADTVTKLLGGDTKGGLRDLFSTWDEIDRRKKEAAGGAAAPPPPAAPAAGFAPGGTAEHPLGSRLTDAQRQWLADVEHAYLPGFAPGTLERLMMTESSGNMQAIGPEITTGPHKGEHALGGFQFLKGTAQKYNVNPFAFKDASLGAAKLLADEAARLGSPEAAVLSYGGFAHPEMAYQGTMDDRMRAYLGKVRPTDTGAAQTTNNVNTTFNINGARDPREVGQEVLRNMKRTWGDLFRNSSGAQR